VLEYKKGAKKPEKILPNQVPTGVDRNDRPRHAGAEGRHGPRRDARLAGQRGLALAKQADQFASQQQLAVPLDNLAYTRHMLATRILKLVQRYYDSYRVFRITETDPATGQGRSSRRWRSTSRMPDGSYFNDITVGDYDVVITEQPMAVTFEQQPVQPGAGDAQEGIKIPDSVVVRYSSPRRQARHPGAAQLALPAPTNTHPNFPAHPAQADVGLHAGIETPALEAPN
jgi:hypothetical protein